MEKEKKELWVIQIRCERTLKVVFDHPVTAQEAEDLYNAEMYEDIIDEYDDDPGEVVHVE